jgi:hypothetical protein
MKTRERVLNFNENKKKAGLPDRKVIGLLFRGLTPWAYFELFTKTE